MKGVKVDEGVLIANLGGNYYAIGNRCTYVCCKLSGDTRGCEKSDFDKEWGSSG
jgi:nitrite reductase/ring-hydroxylating ferredoxin subunit